MKDIHIAGKPSHCPVEASHHPEPKLSAHLFFKDTRTLFYLWKDTQETKKPAGRVRRETEFLLCCFVLFEHAFLFFCLWSCPNPLILIEFRRKIPSLFPKGSEDSGCCPSISGTVWCEIKMATLCNSPCVTPGLRAQHPSLYKGELGVDGTQELMMFRMCWLWSEFQNCPLFPPPRDWIFEVEVKAEM